ncbi:hypothetical protein [Chitinophaga tropicalis]|uniref:Uncharacterized protein n=1 Tax=Chitinophaga tropicalis TaxID=2683588 RepID=A0A7K1U5Z9_9BACT|nr:hypothetical protein [Chitinophaga tropicalis]MVT09793.1 hypothetical protein [Chitinophaga tropicalis]
MKTNINNANSRLQLKKKVVIKIMINDVQIKGGRRNSPETLPTTLTGMTFLV